MKFSKTVGGILLVAGTAIGAGMLALPVITGQSGFLPATLVFILCWLFSASTGLLFLEICLDMPQNANLVTMARQLLGRPGKVAAWILYLFLFYCLTIAYTAGGGNFIYQVFGGTIPKPLTTLLFVSLFGAFVYVGTKAVNRVNYILMGGLILTYLLFIFFGFSQVNTEQLTTINWRYGFLALPVMFTSFSYQGIIPTLNTYLDRDPVKMRKAILIGSAIPLIAYLIWEFLILGIVPAEGANGLIAAKAAGNNAIAPLRTFLNNPTVYLIGEFFGFFALTTSFLGVTLGLLDFLSDSLEVRKTPISKLLLCALIYLPPLVVVLINPNIFLKALGYAGGIGCALLLGLMPILMTWIARYRRQYTHLNTQLPGGKPILLLLAAFVVFELGISLFYP